MDEDGWIDFSYKDINGETQHARVHIDNVAKFIGDMYTKIYKYESVKAKMMEISSEVWRA